MCGIAGLLSLDGRPLPDPAVIDAMCKAITHRGPDDQGVHIANWVQIGMRRLSIIDVAGGRQPIQNETGRIQLVFNGEIYNYRELRADLIALGHRFYTESDSECIVHAYEQYGTDCFRRLRGMFAIAIADLGQRRLILARDRIGKKPLYYGDVAPGVFGFGSEIKTLLAVPGCRPPISGDAVRDFFTFGYVPSPQSIFGGISKLPAAHWMTIDAGSGTIRTERYDRVDFEPKLDGTDEDLQRLLAEKLEDAVRVRLVSDVPFGAFLSGGLDSSIVCALMARNLSRPLKTFTIGFAEDAFNELPDARRVANYLGTDHHELVVTPDAVGLLKDLVWYFDEPFGDSSAIPTYLVSKLAATHVKMVLSGDGGDELFAGYSRYRRFRTLSRLRERTFGLAPLALRAGARLARGPLAGRIGRLAERMALPWPDDYLAGVALATPADRALMFGATAGSTDAFASLRPLFERKDITSPMERILSGDMNSYLVDDIMTKVDRATMANSLEARAPLLDQDLIAFVARLPFRLKLQGSTSKALLRRVAATLLPPEVMQKRKQGFAIPLARWFRTDLQPMMQDTLGSRAFRERGLFDLVGVRTLMSQHQSGSHDRGELLWLLMTFELWMQRFSTPPENAG